VSSINKLQKFSELDTFPNVFQNFNWVHPELVDHKKKVVDLKGKWNELIFKNDHPITLELACGNAEYTMYQAEQYPDRNFIGIDIKGNRMWKGAKDSLEKGFTNTAFIRTQIEYVESFFAPNEITEIWIIFPDPFNRKSKSHKRLTSPSFLKKYRNILKTNAPIHLKTDSDLLYEFTLETIDEQECTLLESCNNIYIRTNLPDILKVKTRYEMMHLGAGKTIKYIQFRL